MIGTLGPWTLAALALCACAHSGRSAMPITQPAQLESAVGQTVTLRGEVTRTKIATLVGVDVESEAPDLRGQEAVASGVLERVAVTPADLDKLEAEAGGHVANRGPGVFYRLVDPATGRLAPVRKP